MTQLLDSIRQDVAAQRSRALEAYRDLLARADSPRRQSNPRSKMERLGA
jgi:hypothetical protein